MPKTQQFRGPAAQLRSNAQVSAASASKGSHRNAPQRTSQAAIHAIVRGTHSTREPIVKSQVLVGEKTAGLLWDTGASLSVVDAAFAVFLAAHKLAKPSPRHPLGQGVTLCAAHKVVMPSSSPVDIVFTVRGHPFFETFVPVENLGVPMIVCPDFMLMRGVAIDLDVQCLFVREASLKVPVLPEFSSSAAQHRSPLFPITPTTVEPHSHKFMSLCHDPTDPLCETTRKYFC